MHQRFTISSPQHRSGFLGWPVGILLMFIAGLVPTVAGSEFVAASDNSSPRSTLESFINISEAIFNQYQGNRYVRT